MTIRQMQINDYEAVYQLWQKTPGMGLNTTDDSREGIAAYLNRNPKTCFVAEEAGRVIGAILAGHDGRRGYLLSSRGFAYEPSKRNREGFGRACDEGFATRGHS